jgi:hypothetical protein
MPEGFTLNFEENETSHRVYITVSGNMHSSEYIDAQIAQLKANAHLLSFDRLADIRLCSGHVAYEDVIRYGQFWSSVKSLMSRDIRVAVITENALTIARLPLSNLSYPRQQMKAFTTIAEAEAWLDEGLMDRVLTAFKAG